MTEGKQGSVRGPYAGGIARRELILDVTDQLVAEVGFHGLSMRDVARRVGISHPGVIYHFPSKEALLMAVIQRHEARFNFDLQRFEGASPEEMLRLFVEKAEEFANDPSIIEMECMLSVEASSTLHPAHDHFRRRNAALVELFKTAIERMQEARLIQDFVDPVELARTMLSLVIGSHLLWLYNRNNGFEPREIMMQALLRYVDLEHPEGLRLVLSMGLTTPTLIRSLEALRGKRVLDMIKDGDIRIDREFLKSYGLEKLPVEMVERVIDSGIVSYEYSAYASQNRAISLEMLGKLVVAGVIDREDLKLIEAAELVSADVVATLVPIAVEHSATKDAEAPEWSACAGDGDAGDGTSRDGDAGAK